MQRFVPTLVGELPAGAPSSCAEPTRPAATARHLHLRRSPHQAGSVPPRTWPNPSINGHGRQLAGAAGATSARPPVESRPMRYLPCPLLHGAQRKNESQRRAHTRRWNRTGGHRSGEADFVRRQPRT